ncbi:unnamed protein product [Phaedon cochleariae]|uniref:Coiled-coil domain-containing protein 102A n=1 Tax=Phaedon cochleariae TaxID=80249 RepID=A0A9P0DVC9_PHACE|nr:unnamed protein product [Phaedon cochleariae]
MAQSTTSGTSSRRHARDHDTASITSSRIADISEWEANEALRQRELEEAKGRAAQMEKTMRWWSDCTANWREKWSKVRNERNKAREECKQLRTKLESLLKDGSTSKRDKEDLELQNDQLKKEIERIHILLLKHAGQFDSQILEALGDDPLKEFGFSSESPVKERENGVSSSHSNPECDSTAVVQSVDSDNIEEYVLQGAVPRYLKESERRVDSEPTNGVEKSSDREYDEECFLQKLSMVELRLEETTKILQVERDEKSQLHHTIERLTSDLQEAKEKCEELRDARQDTMRDILLLQDEHQKELQLIKADLQDEANSREGMDKRLSDLRAELERLQAENAAEWGKRERLETEKLAMERDNKKLRSELRDMQERIERKGRPLTNSDAEIRHLQQEITDKNKEISELRHAQIKYKKTAQDKTTELAHCARRAEQYETEVKKLRARIEELKRDLAAAEDELDAAGNAARRLQRSNEELQEQVDGLQVQLQHLHTSMEKEDGGEEMAQFDENDCLHGTQANITRFV